MIEMKKPRAGAVARRVILVGASYGTKNMGVNALAAGTVASVQASLPGARFAFMDYSKEAGSHQVRSSGGDAEIPLLNIRFSKKLGLHNNIARLIVAAALHRLVPGERWKAKVRKSHPQLEEILKADVVVAISGGDSFSDIYGMSRLFYVCLPQVLAIMAGRPLVLLPQTVGPFSTWLGRRLGRFILRRASRTYCRDRQSLAEADRMLGGAGRAHLAYDMGFALEPLAPKPAVVEEVVRLRAQGTLIGFNVSGLLYAGGYTGRNEFGLNQDYKELVGRVLNTLLAMDGVQVMLVPHVMGGPHTDESDITACEKVYQQYAGISGGRLHTLRAEVDHHEVKYVIGQCDFFLGSRMHACIAALSQCVPAVGLAYSRKFAGVFETIGCEALVIDLTRESGDSVVATLGRQFQERARTKGQLEAKMPEVRRAILGLFREIDSAVRMKEVN